MDLLQFILLLSLLLTCCHVAAMPEQGTRSAVMIPEPDTKGSWTHYAGLSKSMYADSFLSVDVHCTSPQLAGTIQWVVRSSFCANEFLDYDDENYEMLSAAFETTDRSVGDPRLFKHKYLKSEPVDFSCNNNSTFKLPTFTDQQWLDAEVILPRKYSGESDEIEEKSDDFDSAGDTFYHGDGEDSYEDDLFNEDATEAPVVGENGDKSRTKVGTDTEREIGTNAVANTSREGHLVGSNRIRQRRAASTPAAGGKVDLMTTTKEVSATRKWATTSAPLIRNPDALVRVPIDSVYMFVMSANYDDKIGQLHVTAETYGDYGYLSAIDWPLLPFYGTMCAVYTLSLIAWFALCCCFRKGLLQIHYLIGVVIYIGFVEQATFYVEYQTVNITGKSLPGLLIFGELLSTTTSALSRVLFIVISVGFGTVKPRLGPTLHVVVAVGISYFTLRCIGGFWRATTHKANQQTTGLLILLILLFVVDAFVCCWIFASLIRTIRTLRSRQNDHKLSLYRNFTIALILSFLAILGFMIWSVLQHKRVECLKGGSSHDYRKLTMERRRAMAMAGGKIAELGPERNEDPSVAILSLQDWKDLWVDEAFWHLQFYVMLLVTMILFRPSANSQMCIYSLTVDGDDGDAVKPLMKEYFDYGETQPPGFNNSNEKI